MSGFAITTHFDIDVDFGRRPSLISLRLFGCIAHAHVPGKAVEGIHIRFRRALGCSMIMRSAGL
ncbi:uncharacterized protein EI90DRAFT_3042082 [Cantharellus anzutake]|uniref:uncharacterized protein n=1 Tax=Cantharellus anzutake TaxID=1750568 RepID=UPI001906487C|nr:uncharacterized protein EI90DRAFT_3042082 [Cantharellus anzutake]KAF8338203.1 hypothetical protein EI90DRAFT_3042082 [Cantharellus anzutake]